jgi:hypothetical protein
VLGTAKVMSYEDLTAACAKRAEQEEKRDARKKKRAEARAKRIEQEEKGEAAPGRKRTGDRKRGVGSSRAHEPDATSEASRAGDEPGATVAAQAAEAGWIRGPMAPCPGRAPVARMW